MRARRTAPGCGTVGAVMSLALDLALTANKATFGLVIVFFVAFPALAHVLIGIAVAGVFGERAENERYRQGLDD